MVIQQAFGGLRRGVAGHTAIKDRAQGVEIGPGAIAVIAGGVLFRRRIARRHQAGYILTVAADCRPGRAKINQHDPMIAGANVEIGGLDVAVQITLLMHRLQGGHHILQQAAHLLLMERSTLFQNRAQGFPFLVFHDDVGGAIGAEVAFDPHHVGMLNPGQHPRFVEETLQSPFVIGGLPAAGAGQPLGIGMDHHAIGVAKRPFDREVFLDGDQGVQVRVQRLVGHAEPARSQNGFDAVFVQHIARWQGVGPMSAALGWRGRGLGGVGAHNREPGSVKGG